MKNQNAVILFARTPEIRRSPDGEPFGALPWEDLDDIFHACLGDIVSRAAEVPDADVLVYRDERYLPAAKFTPRRENVRAVDMPAGEFEPVVGQAVEHAFLEFYHRVAVVLENNPLVGAPLISRAFDQLGTDDDSIVITPTPDGRAGMLALKANHPSLFRQGGGKPEGGLLARLCGLEVHLYPTGTLFPLDSPAALDRLRRDVAALDPSGPEFPKLTSGVFRALEKKYRLKKVGA